MGTEQSSNADSMRSDIYLEGIWPGARQRSTRSRRCRTQADVRPGPTLGQPNPSELNLHVWSSLSKVTYMYRVGFCSRIAAIETYKLII